MGKIDLSFNGDQVKFTESRESLADYAKHIDNVPQQSASAWDQVNRAVGQYDPFNAWENDN